MTENLRIQIKIYMIIISVAMLMGILLLSFMYKEKKIAPLSKEDAASLLSFTHHTKEEWKVSLNSKKDNVTYADLANVLKELQISDEVANEAMYKKKELVPLEVWFQEYEKIVAKFDTEGKIKTKNLAFIGSKDNCETLEEDSVYTNEGLFSCHSPLINQYMYHNVTAICNENQILYIKGEQKEAIYLRNVWFSKQTKDGFQIFVDHYYFNFNSKGLSGNVSNQLGDVAFQGGKISGVRLKADRISGKILSLQPDSIEIEGYGKVPLATDFRVYTIYGKLDQLSLDKLLIGYNVTEFVVAEGKLCAGLVTQTLTMDHIRVLIKTSNFDDIFHKDVTLTATTDFTICYGKNKENHMAGEEIKIAQDSPYWTENRIKIEPNTLSGEVVLNSVHRSLGTPSYRGTIEIVKDENGLIVINDILLESYLYAVVPSEMPESYGLEALKAQAVCARSYAYNQILQNSYAKYGAHVDDSVTYQVYNNQEETDLCTEAVKETNGQVALYNGSVIQAYYFSTSCGHTTNCTAWPNADPQSMAYLQGNYIGAGSYNEDLTKEEKFASFITNTNYDGLEKSEPWYRWNTTISANDLSDTLNGALGKMQKAKPDLILVKGQDGNFTHNEITSIGTIKNITVSKRGEGGVANEVIVEGDKATIQIITEYVARVLLAPVKSAIHKNDGSIVQGAKMLPSAYFIVQKQEEKDKPGTYTFIGGGYGHGVGMSQNGAKIMASKGNNYKQILSFFYQNIALHNIYG